MAGKSGRSINNVPKSPVKQMIFSWEGILVLLFIAVNIFCANFSEFYNLKSLLRQMPVYLVFLYIFSPTHPLYLFEFLLLFVIVTKYILFYSVLISVF